MVLIAPLLFIIFMANMLAQGNAHKLPVAVVDLDQSAFSRQIIRHVMASPSLDVTMVSPTMLDAEDALKRCKVWAVLQIPEQAEVRIHRSQSPRLASYYNAAFFSIASTVSSGINAAVNAAVKQEQRQMATAQGVPTIRMEIPGIAVTPLYNPQFSYELFVEPFAVTAVLHLILACCVAASVAAGFDPQSKQERLVFAALTGKLLPYVIVFVLWCFGWTIWMIAIRGWAVQGSLLILLLAQWLLFMAYAFFASTVVLLLKDLGTALSLVAIYGGSSMSYAGISLPTNTASIFTRVWSNSLPFTAYSHVQTQQWVIGAPCAASIPDLLALLAFVLGLGLISYRLLKKNWQQQGAAI